MNSNKALIAALALHRAGHLGYLASGYHVAIDGITLHGKTVISMRAGFRWERR